MTSIGYTPGGVEITAWVLKGHPDIYDVDHVLESLSEISGWSVHRSYRTELMAAGQRCFLWRSGPNGAFVATGHLTGPVAPGQADPQEWEDPAKAMAADLFAPIELEALDVEIERDVLKADQLLSNMELLRSPQMSNPSILTPEELQRLDSLITGRGSG